MPTLYERNVTRDGSEGPDQNEGQLDFFARIDPANETEDDLWDLLDATLPATYRGQPFKSAKLQPQGGGVYYPTASYGSGKNNPEQNQPQNEGDSVFDFETTGGTGHVAYSRQTMLSATDTITGTNGTIVPGAPNFKQGINASGTEVSGVDITVPKFSFTYKKLVRTSSLTQAALRFLAEATGTVNDRTFTIVATNGITMGFFAGELRFDGITGSQKKPGLYELVYHFVYERNVTPGDGSPIKIGAITIDDKQGHDYVWVYKRPSVDGVANARVQLPIAAYVERVYRRFDFRNLGVGA